MAITIRNESWLLSDTLTENYYSKTLKTAGTFVDKDIKIELVPKKGSVAIESKNIEILPVISKIEDKYVVSVTKNISITPTVTEGWVSTGNSGEIDITGQLIMNQTVLDKGLTSSSTEPSGYAAYDFTATNGYNKEDLKDSLNVFQGLLDIT